MWRAGAFADPNGDNDRSNVSFEKSELKEVDTEEADGPSSLAALLCKQLDSLSVSDSSPGCSFPNRLSMLSF